MNNITKAADIKLIALDESWWKNPESITDKETPLPQHFVDNSYFKVWLKPGRRGLVGFINSLSYSLAQTFQPII